MIQMQQDTVGGDEPSISISVLLKIVLLHSSVCYSYKVLLLHQTLSLQLRNGSYRTDPSHSHCVLSFLPYITQKLKILFKLFQ
jgi:hypothetical protein